jgi:glycosyltransferase involved in cell wall biosynthesis
MPPATPPEPAVSVVVPAFDSKATIAGTLDALAAQELEQPYEVIVVDDSSSDGTAAIAEGASGPVRVIRSEHLGAAAARNLGAAAAKAAVLAFTDADCEPDPHWLSAGLGAIADADLVQGVVRPSPGAKRFPFDRTLWVVEEAGLYETANLLVRRDLFERLGGFQDLLGAEGRPLSEDVWFGWRARRGGAVTAFSEDVVVHHAVFETNPVEHVAERARLVHFPALAAKIPELRETMFYRHWFLSRRTAAFDAALTATAAALVARRRAPLLAAVPYGWILLRRAKGWGRHAPEIIAAEAAADAVGCIALAAGSVRSRSPVL